MPILTEEKRIKLLGGLYGALVGDAVGVPYEFNHPNRLPPFDQLDMIPPKGFSRTWPNIQIGTYSDDGAQLLCHLEVQLNKGTAGDLLTSLKRWAHEGYMSVDSNTFDIGNQTSMALHGLATREELMMREMSGNGSLMRCLPAALTARIDVEAFMNGYEQSQPTHPSYLCSLTCGVYAVTAYYLLNYIGDIDIAVKRAFSVVRNNSMIKLNDVELAELDFIEKAQANEPTGSGYVVNSFWSAIYSVRISKTYEETIKNAIALGCDTDTTACIAGGLAGLIHGVDGIPNEWLQRLRGRENIEPLARRMINEAR